MLKNYSVLITPCAYLIYMFTSYCYLFTNLCITLMIYLSLSLIISLQTVQFICSVLEQEKICIYPQSLKMWVNGVLEVADCISDDLLEMGKVASSPVLCTLYCVI